MCVLKHSRAACSSVASVCCLGGRERGGWKGVGLLLLPVEVGRAWRQKGRGGLGLEGEGERGVVASAGRFWGARWEAEKRESWRGGREGGVAACRC